MFYFHADNDYIILLPSLAFSFRGEFWIEIDWLNFNFGWRSGNEVQKPDLTYEEVEQIIKDLLEKAITALREALDLFRDATKKVVEKAEQEPSCNQHPDAPHGFARNASHNAGRYVCECEGWEPEQEPVAQVVKSCKTFNVYEAIVDTGNKLLAADTKLYAAPVRTKDLTPDELFSIANKVGFDGELMKTNHDRGMPSIAEQYARAVIAADREKNK